MTAASLTEEDQGGVEPFESSSGLPYSSVGGKRRTRGKRNSRKRSQRKSKKYMKKMYRGGNDTNENTNENTNEKEQLTQNQNQNQNQESEQNGGRRRRKGKMNKGKTRKGKVSKWITHVKNFSRANKMDFRDALKDPKCKASYHKMK